MDTVEERIVINSISTSDMAIVLPSTETAYGVVSASVDIASILSSASIIVKIATILAQVPINIQY